MRDEIRLVELILAFPLFVKSNFFFTNSQKGQSKITYLAQFIISFGTNIYCSTASIVIIATNQLANYTYEYSYVQKR